MPNRPRVSPAVAPQGHVTEKQSRRKVASFGAMKSMYLKCFPNDVSFASFPFQQGQSISLQVDEKPSDEHNENKGTVNDETKGDDVQSLEAQVYEEDDEEVEENEEYHEVVAADEEMTVDEAIGDKQVRGDDDDDVDKIQNIFTNRKLTSSSTVLTLKQNTTNVDVIVPIIANAVRSNWTYQCLVRALKMEAGKYLESGIPADIKGLWRLLSRNDEANTKRFYYCEMCNSMMGHDVLTLVDCKCGKYKPREGKKLLIPYFIQVLLAPQIRQLLQTPTIFDSLQYRRTRMKRNADTMEDIYDGKKYKQMSNTDNGFLSNANNFSLTMNTDGCSVAKSSNTSAWPILFQVNEFPPHLRKRHILLGGIWVSDRHPDLNMFMYPTIKELQELYKVGVLWEDPTDGVMRTSKIATNVCTVDTPARADVFNMTRFNGKYGCTFCLATGESKTGTPGQRVYPINETKALLRDDASMRRDMMSAHFSETKERVNGCKGVSAMATLYEFDLACGQVVESMHNVYLGVTKLHMTLLFNGKADEPWYNGHPAIVSAVDTKLKGIQRPSRIARSTRSLKEMKHWKANEWRNWLLYYGVVCLNGIIDDSHVWHLALLSRAAYIYNKDSISTDDLKEARSLIQKYVQKFQDTFGEKHMKFNVHLLTHLSDTVENWGPLWVHSAFPFESWNKRIIDHVTSANARTLQIVIRHMMYTFVESLLYDPSIKENTRNVVASILFDGTKKGMRHHERNGKVYLFETNRAITERIPNNWEIATLQAASVNNVDSLASFRNVRIRGINYERHDEDSTQTKRYSDSYIYYNREFARIIDIVQCMIGKNVIAQGFFVQVMKSVTNVCEAKHIHGVELTSIRRFVRVVDNAPKPAVRIADVGFEFTVALSNLWESD